MSVPVLLLTLLVWSTGPTPTVQAAPNQTVTVGCVDPDFESIQEAVNNVGAGSTILICAGTYSESVNLSLMGSESGDTLGDIALRKSGAGTVLIDTEVGPGIFITPGGYFSGSITLVGIDVAAADVGYGNSYGIDLSGGDVYAGAVQGATVLDNVKAWQNAGGGARIAAAGAVTVVNSDFYQNKAGPGLEIVVATVYDSALIANVPTVYVDNVQATDNAAYGMYISTIENVDVRNSVAADNGTQGVGLESSGIHIEHRYLKGDPCPFTVESSNPRVDLFNTRAENNQGHGVYIYSQFDVLIAQTQVISNAYDGLAAYAGQNSCGSNLVRLESSTAEYNGYGEYQFQTLDEGEAGAAGVSPGLPFGGFRLYSTDQVEVLNNNLAEENEHFGYCIVQSRATEITVQDSTADGNEGHGFAFDGNCSEAFYLSTPQPETAGGETLDSVDAAIAVTAPTLAIVNVTAISNTGAGFTIPVVSAAVNLTNVSALHNRDGIVILQRVFSKQVVDSTLTVPLPTPAPVVVDSLIMGNSGYGVRFDQLAQEIVPVSISNIVTPVVYSNTATIGGSIICENGTGVGAIQTVFVPVLGDASIQADGDVYQLIVDGRGNWWGSTTGPTSVENPTGTGDSIEETWQFVEVQPVATPSNEVHVDFAPWINTFHADATPNPTILGVPVALEYRFSDAGQSYFLRNGVGNLNDAPIFKLSTDNGTIDGQNPVHRFLANTRINGTLTPANTGTATVLLDGPCGLDQTVVVQVPQPAIAVDKQPAIQGVAPGNSANFTITVRNTGGITLTEVAVADPIAPDCSRAEGALGDLGIGESTTYACSLVVNNNLVNTVTASGKALVGGEPAGNPVTDQATAQVLVAGLVLTKTVFVDGYREHLGGGAFNPSECALNSTITVPVSTTVKFCYTVTNTGDYTIVRHSLVDSVLGPIFGGLPVELAPGESFSTVDAGLVLTETLFVTTTNIATWTGELAPPVVVVVGPNAANATVAVVASTSATVNISTELLDQDGDGIPDNTEKTGDLDGDGIPNFLDPDTPTGLDEVDQPNLPEKIFLPALNR